MRVRVLCKLYNIYIHKYVYVCVITSLYYHILALTRFGFVIIYFYFCLLALVL